MARIMHTRSMSAAGNAVVAARNDGIFIAYYPTPAARATIGRWPHGAVILGWEVDDDTGQVVAICLTPMVEGTKGRGHVMRDRNKVPHFILPCSAVGKIEVDFDNRRQAAEEVITEAEITVRLPSSFRFVKD
jgi:hypothetical protein